MCETLTSATSAEKNPNQPTKQNRTRQKNPEKITLSVDGSPSMSSVRLECKGERDLGS